MTTSHTVEGDTEIFSVASRESDPFHMKRCASLLLVASEQNEGAIAEAARLIVETRGHVHGVGVGKSGYVARLFAATLQTIGISASFLHASDALHGEAGSILDGNLAVVFSHSGATGEVLALLDIFEQRAVPAISVVGDALSPLAMRSRIALITGVAQAMELHSIVPTTSTVVATSIAMGLVAATAEAVDLDEAAFRASHPAGRLGWDLNRRVSKVMRPTGGLPVARTGETLKGVAAALARTNASACCIQDERGNVYGILGRQQVERRLRLGEALIDVASLNTAPSVPATSSIHEARLVVENLADGQPVAVRDAERLVGFFFASDLHPPSLYF